jgi:hypothetical protein
VLRVTSGLGYVTRIAGSTPRGTEKVSPALHRGKVERPRKIPSSVRLEGLRLERHIVVNILLPDLDELVVGSQDVPALMHQLPSERVDDNINNATADGFDDALGRGWAGAGEDAVVGKAIRSLE